MKTLLKYFLLAVMFSFSGASTFAAPWGALADYNEPRPNGEKSGQKGEMYLLHDVLAGRPIRISLYLPSNAFDKMDFYKELIARSYERWFSYPAELIRSSGREAEFADVLPILDRGIPVKFVDYAQEADINVSVFSFAQIRSICGTAAAGCFVKDGENTPRMFLVEDKFLNKVVTGGQLGTKRIGLHEIGHSLGLSDQYEQARAFLTHPVYSTDDSPKSVMNKSLDLTCDDADGIINLIDITRGSSRGGEFGWRSLCKKSDVYYLNGAPVGKGPYFIRYFAKERRGRMDFFEKGRMVSQQNWLMDLQGQVPALQEIKTTALQYDKTGRPVRLKGSKGEDVYCSYTYDRQTCLFFAGDDLVRAEEKGNVFAGKRKNKKIEYKIRYFAEDGKAGSLEYSRQAGQKGKAGRVLYVLGADKQNPDRVIELNFDKKGQLINQQIFPGEAEIPQGVSSRLTQSVHEQVLARKIQEIVNWYLKQP